MAGLDDPRALDEAAELGADHVALGGEVLDGGVGLDADPVGGLGELAVGVGQGGALGHQALLGAGPALGLDALSRDHDEAVGPVDGDPRAGLSDLGAQARSGGQGQDEGECCEREASAGFEGALSGHGTGSLAVAAGPFHFSLRARLRQGSLAFSPVC
ncbi:hypothetical protein D3C86_1460950 [compost metagenome]